MNDRDHFTLRNIAKKSGCSVSDIQQYFSGKSAILMGFYNNIPDQYRTTLSEIEGFDSLTIDEQVSNYIYTTFDILSEERDFVEETFEKMVMHGPTSTWEKESVVILRKFIESDPRIPTLNKLMLREFTFSILAREYMQIVRFWLNDTSEGSERTLALVDKITSFGKEIAYSGVLDKGVDLAKYVFGNDIWKSRVPDFQEEFSKFREHFPDVGRAANDIRQKSESILSEICNKWKQPEITIIPIDDDEPGQKPKTRDNIKNSSGKSTTFGRKKSTKTAPRKKDKK